MSPFGFGGKGQPQSFTTDIADEEDLEEIEEIASHPKIHEKYKYEMLSASTILLLVISVPFLQIQKVAAKHHSDDESSDVGSDDQSSGQESTDDHSNDSGPVDGQDMLRTKQWRGRSIAYPITSCSYCFGWYHCCSCSRAILL